MLKAAVFAAALLAVFQFTAGVSVAESGVSAFQKSANMTATRLAAIDQ